MFHFGKMRHCLRVSSPFLSGCAAKKPEWRRRRTATTGSYSIASRGKQLFNFFAITDIQKKIHRVSIP